MRRGITLLVAILLLSVAANADEVNWRWRFGTGTYFGTASGASDGYDLSDGLVSFTESGVGHLGVYHQNGVDGWNGDTGFYSTDIRAPIPAIPGYEKSWVLYLWADASYAYPWFGLGWGFSSPNIPAFSAMEYQLKYVRVAEGITGGPVVGTSILLNQQSQGTWGFPVYRTDDGTTGYVFELTARVVPEPSSLLALGVGGFGLLGTALRRRIRVRA